MPSRPHVSYISGLIHAARTMLKDDDIITALLKVNPKVHLALVNFLNFPSSTDNNEEIKIAPQLFDRICFDIKRCGDWEQVESVHAVAKKNPDIGATMLGTGDILCMTQARIKGLCGVWHNEKTVKDTDEDAPPPQNEEGGKKGPGDPQAWNIVVFRNPQTVNKDMVDLFEIRDIVGKLQKPLQIIFSRCLDSTVAGLEELSRKCGTVLNTYAHEDSGFNIGPGPLEILHAHIYNVRKCNNNINLLTTP